jgi:hypothetical protein
MQTSKSNVIGLWGTAQGVTDAVRRRRDSGPDEVVTSLGDAVVQLAKHAPTRAEQLMPADVEERASAYNFQHGAEKRNGLRSVLPQ